MNLDLMLRSEIEEAVSALFNQSATNIQLQPTNQEFEGSHTVVCFPLTKFSEKSPEETARVIGRILASTLRYRKQYNVVKGFLNLVIHDRIVDRSICNPFIPTKLRTASRQRPGDYG